MEKLMKELRALLDKIKEYKSLEGEARTVERRSQNTADMARIAEIEADIADLQRIEEIEARTNTSVNNRPEMNFQHAEVEDQPIYRGAAALGHQMVDIATLSTPNSNGYAEARGRFDSMVKREKVLAEKRAAGTGGMVMATGQDGGLLLQGETSMDMITNGFNNSQILQRAANRDLGTSQFIDFVGLDETSRVAGSRGGGIRVYTDKELALMTQSKTQFSKIRVEPKRLTGMYFASDEILQNAPALTGEMNELFLEEFAFKGQDIVINGTGSGEGLGVLKAPCLVTVAAVAGQVAGTLLYENLIDMKVRVRRRSKRSLLWVANSEVEKPLTTLSLPIGTGGTLIPAFIPSNNPADGVDGTLLGIPIVFVEQCAALGTIGDIILGDWSMYYAANKGGIESASSIHLKFDYNQTAFRFVTWFDGQPRVQSAITPYKGSNTVSPFVALATR